MPFLKQVLEFFKPLYLLK